MTSPRVVHIRNLGIVLGGELTVTIEALAMRAGEVVVLDAASGAGKSTVLGLISGALEPNLTFRDTVHELSGQTILPGMPRDSFAGPGQMGFVLQTNVLVPYLTIGENITLPMTIAEVEIDPDWHAHLLAALGIDGLMARMPTGVSVGQRQRATIARALLGKPDLLLLDEPVSALDPVNVGQVERLIEVLAEDANCAVILASHQAAQGAFANARHVSHEMRRDGAMLQSVFSDQLAAQVAAQ